MSMKANKNGKEYPIGVIPQNVIDKVIELDAKVNRGSVSVTADGVKTLATLLSELHALIDTSKITPNSYFIYKGSDSYYFRPTLIEGGRIHLIGGSYVLGGQAQYDLTGVRIASSASSCGWDMATFKSNNTIVMTHNETAVISNGVELIFCY